MDSSRSSSAAASRSLRQQRRASSARDLRDGGSPVSGPEALGVLIERAVGVLGAAARLAECRAVLSWPEVVGPLLARHSRAVRVVGRRLEVAVPAAVWRNQLSLMQQELVGRVNSVAGSAVIDGLVLVNREISPKAQAAQRARSRTQE